MLIYYANLCPPLCKSTQLSCSYVLKRFCLDITIEMHELAKFKLAFKPQTELIYRMHGKVKVTCFLS